MGNRKFEIVAGGAPPAKPTRRFQPTPFAAADLKRAIEPLADGVPSLARVRGGAVAKFCTCAEFEEHIGGLWREADRLFVDIGRALNRAKAVLSHGEFTAMVDGALPFSHSVGNRLMKVAEAIDAGRLPVERLPPSYATAYELVSLTDAELAQADARGLVRPDVQRHEVVAFKRAARPLGRPAPEVRRDAILSEIARLEARIEQLRRELDAEERPI